MTSFPIQVEAGRTLPRDVAGCFVPGERVLVAAKPAVISIVLRRLGAFVAILIGTVLLVWLAMEAWLPITAFAALLLGATGFAVLAFWGHLDWAMRDFVLTDRRVIAGSGVIRRLAVESPIEVLQQVVVYKSLRERIFGLGSVGLSTPADAGLPSVVWGWVAEPDVLVAQVRLQMARSGSLERVQATPQQGLPVIGLAGGIGSGKSTVAGILARLGCLVVDSDARAKAALDRPEVARELVKWWGEGILSESVDAAAQKRVDRAKVAQIVFANPEERKRLESLVHPIVRHERAEARREGAAAGARAVVIDAPLLFEAGLDAECDAVIFVDAPRSVRLERVKTNRGWTEEELTRREAAQLPLQSKRAKADYVVVNDGPVADLEARVAGILNSILSGARGRSLRGKT